MSDDRARARTPARSDATRWTPNATRLEALKFIAEGHTSDEIAGILHQPQDRRRHRQNILENSA